jgi:cell division septum initiation protein DivIVA
MAEQGKVRANSKLEQKLDELYYLIDSAKATAFSKSKVVIDRDVAFEILEDMRKLLPEELVKYHEMTNQYGNIIGAAQERATSIEQEARDKQAKLINEHKVVTEAYAQADTMINNARSESDAILMSANQEADVIKEGAFSYTQDMMQQLQGLLSEAYRLMDTAYRPFMEGVEKKLEEVNMALEGLEEPVDYEEEETSSYAAAAEEGYAEDEYEK